MLVLRLTGKAEQVFKLLSAMASKDPNKTIKELSNGDK